MNHIRSLFLLDPEIHFLNHGSFGACPRPVFEAYQHWQRRLERQPVLFLGREYDTLLGEARAALGAYLNAPSDDLVYIPNATHGVNIVARSLSLQPGDEILTSDHEYGACDLTWQFVCGKRGAKYVRQPIPLPIHSEEEIVRQFWAGVTERTRVIYLSHITSPTALRLPVERICALARQAGILTVIDAAHAPGQIPLDLQALGADVVFGNLHKWMMSPKGAAFLYVRPEVQPMLEPLVVSWGYGKTSPAGNASRFVDLFQWTGTHDPAAALSVPAAIQFMYEQDWDTVRQDCHILLVEAIKQVCSLTGLPMLYPLEGGFFSQMAIAPLPLETNLSLLKTRLYDEHRVEVPLIAWNGHQFVRISIQGYNTPEDVSALVNGLARCL
ncbi:MAG: aminotransferase class V-fold PLP-dependent enzyme [Anaerolineales bacterium]|nr:aminotransferase class V-fold PLP-dependent enzyme [Anaerolineales bacterium]MDW8278754.1 aminotransferase class V-fold PLP-dependent enzyme [Anaerolineales bacterium]